MFEPNVKEVSSRLKAGDLVLDVGAWACPFNRADWALDSEPYETRGFYRTFGGAASQGGEQEHFTRDTWVQRDICARDPWPFEDKQFDFAICSHVLEDVRDPLWVCSELIRVAKRGYIETPSFLWELCRGSEHPRLAGLSHHRWLVDYEGGALSFLMKFHFVHVDLRSAAPKKVLQRLSPELRVSWLWWDSSFDYQERVIHGLPTQMAWIRALVGEHYQYTRAQLRAERVRAIVARIAVAIRRRLE